MYAGSYRPRGCHGPAALAGSQRAGSQRARIRSVRPLSDAEIAEANLAGWTNKSGALWISFSVPDYETAAAFVADVAHLAETTNHHPDLSLRYGVMDVVLRTHHRDLGVTDLDVDMAGTITVIAERHGLRVLPGEAC